MIPARFCCQHLSARHASTTFKKRLFAIDEAEDEWSQHNAKKLIDTTEKGLQASIPKDFPYFHVQFGLNKGFVHVIDNEDEFKSSLGINVIRGMLQLPVEDMHGRQRYVSVEVQKEAVKSFVQDWEPFDWTKQLHHSYLYTLTSLGPNSTQLLESIIVLQSKSSWPELVGVQGTVAEATIERENSYVDAVIVPEGSSVILDFRCDRVWVWVDKNGIVYRVPTIG
ncbi:hypothetical protein SO802_026883 [Lithocarpus litseifolius]|uniref:Cwf19-like protein C-terminal domain-containing protein n=1 Tax=Lithocarpus litseifolius TaxID=425828 RepID=A0AAW2C1R8_9ROSI